MTQETREVDRRHNILTRMYQGETTFDFVHRWRSWLVLSAVVIVVGLLSLWFRGLSLGIDFEGGTAWEVDAPGVSVSDTREVLRPLGLADARIQELGASSIRVQHQTSDADTVDEATEVLADLAGAGRNEVSVDTVGPSWGEEITSKAQRALVLFLLAIALYITLRFEWKMAAATLAAVVHDLVVVVGVYSITGFEVTPATVIAILTILGYSIYDTIVVFDKVNENTRGLAASGRMTYGDMVNVSLNQVLMRSINTTVTTLLPNAALLVIGAQLLGAVTLSEFALALLVGLAASTYSSLFVASPILAALKEREPRYTSIRERLEARGGTGVITPAAAAAGRSSSGSGGGGSGSGSSGGASGGGSSTEDRPSRPAPPPRSAPPRPRKKTRRRR